MVQLSIGDNQYYELKNKTITVFQLYLRYQFTIYSKALMDILEVFVTKISLH